MKIVEYFPYQKCHDCKECILSVKERIVFHDNETHKQLVVRCKNFYKDCKRELYDPSGEERR